MQNNWEDILLFDEQLSEEERIIQRNIHEYCQNNLMPRILEANRDEVFHKEIYQELGESTLAIHLKIKSLADLVTKMDTLEDNYSASEYIIQDVNSAGSLVGLNSKIIDYLTKLSNKNYALSGGFRGEKISDNLRVYYSTRFMFPFSNLTKTNFNEESLKNFLVIAKHE